MEEIKKTLFSFISLFIAIDPVGILPFFVEISEKLKWKGKRRLIAQSLLTGGIIGCAFIFSGSFILKILRIDVSDFHIAGGSLLFVFALHDLFTERKFGMLRDAGVVPLGTPLIVGPATLTTILLLNESVGQIITFLSFSLNILLLFLFMVFSEKIIDFAGSNALRAAGKVISLFLASIGVMMVRKGIEAVLKQLKI